MNPDKARIVYTSDDRYAELLGVSLTSLYSQSQDMAEIVVYILDGGISEENRKKIEEVCQSFGRRLPVWMPGQDISRKLAMDVHTDRGSLSQYARLFIASDLPELSRVLYLDCDTLFRKSVRELWNLDLHGKTAGVLLDAFSPAYRKLFDLEKNDVMFNSGVMLVDLERWKQLEIEKKLLAFIEEKNGNIQQGDQGALDAVLSRDVYCFSPRYNAVTIFFDFSYDEMKIYRKQPEGYYSREEITRAVEDPVIVHFTSSFLSKRPWEVGSAHRYTEEWRAVKALSPWKDAPLREDPSPWWERVAPRLPRSLMLRLAGIAQAYVRPYYFRLK